MKIGEYIEFIKQADMVGGTNFFDNGNSKSTLTVPRIYPNTFVSSTTPTHSPKVSDSFNVIQKPKVDLVSRFPPPNLAEEAFTDLYMSANGVDPIPGYLDGLVNKAQRINETFDTARQSLYSPNNPIKKNLILRNIPFAPDIHNYGALDKTNWFFSRPTGFEFKPVDFSYENIPATAINLSSENLPNAIHEVVHGLQPSEYSTFRAGALQLNPSMEAYANRTMVDMLDQNLRNYPEVQSQVMPYINDNSNVNLNTYYSQYRPEVEFPEDVTLFPLERNEDWLNSPGFRQRFKQVTGTDFLNESLTRNSKAYPQASAYQKGLIDSGINRSLIDNIQDITSQYWDNSAAWYNNPELLKRENLAWFAPDSYKHTKPTVYNLDKKVAPYWEMANAENGINYKFDAGKDMYNPNYSPFPLTEGYKPIPGFPEGINPRTPIRNPYNPTAEELSQLPNLYTTEVQSKALKPLKYIERAGKAMGPAFAYYEGLPDAQNITKNVSNWTYDLAKKYEVPEEYAKKLSEGAYGALLPTIATVSAYNQVPRVAADFTVAAPTDLVNLGIAGTNALGLTNSEYLPRPETENLTVANAVQHPVQFSQDAAKAISTGVNNINPGRFDVHTPNKFEYPEGFDPVNEEDVSLFKQMSEMQAQGLNHGLNYMYMPEDERTKLYYQYDGERQQYEDIVKQEKRTIAEATKRGLSGIDTVKQHLERDQRTLNQINMEMYALKKVSPALQQQLWLLEGNVPYDERPSYKEPVYNPISSGYTNEQVRDLLTPIE